MIYNVLIDVLSIFRSDCCFEKTHHGFGRKDIRCRTVRKILASGVISAGLAIYDTMQLLTCKVATICVGECASMATVLLSAGSKGKRYALPHATIHIHQARGGATGQASDIEIHAKEVLRRNQIVKEILARHTGRPLEDITRDTDRDFFMDANAAKEYGIIDEILTGAQVPVAAGSSKE